MTPLNSHNLTPRPSLKSFIPENCQVDSALLPVVIGPHQGLDADAKLPGLNPHRWRVKPGFSVDLSSTHLNAISWYSLDKGVGIGIVLWVYHWVKPIKINLSVIGGLHRHVDEKGRRKHQDPFATEAKEDMTWWTRFIILWSGVYLMAFSFNFFIPLEDPLCWWWSSITRSQSSLEATPRP